MSPQNLWLGNINDIGIGLVSPSYKAFKFVNVNTDFIKPQFTQGASVVRRNLELDSFYQIQMRVPNEDEQNKIGKLFFNPDPLITLHQHEHENTKFRNISQFQILY